MKVKLLFIGGINMCTAITYHTQDHYFGRNLDLELSYGQQITITPRNFNFPFRKIKDISSHYAIIGMAAVRDNYPLYFDATNEKGLAMAGLNFEGNAHFFPENPDNLNISPFEFIQYILGQCATIDETKTLLNEINLVNIDFSAELPLAPLHWLIADRECSIVVESVKDGLKVYDNPVGVLTNNPTFDIQLFSLNNYRSVSPVATGNRFSNKIELDEYSRGMGTLGLPGDLTSNSRFIKATFTKLNTLPGQGEDDSVSQFFHILKSVEQQKGLCNVGNDKFEYTIYSSCCNVDKGIYYYTTYNNSQVTGVNMHHTDLNSDELFIFPVIDEQQVNMLN